MWYMESKTRSWEAEFKKIHNILNQHWEGTLASPNMQQTRKIKNKNV
jgi:hypothetical protein